VGHQHGNRGLRPARGEEGQLAEVFYDQVEAREIEAVAEAAEPNVEGEATSVPEYPYAIQDFVFGEPRHRVRDLDDLVPGEDRPPHYLVEVDLGPPGVGIHGVPPVEDEEPQEEPSFRAKTPITEPREVPAGDFSIALRILPLSLETAGMITGRRGMRTPIRNKASRRRR